MTQRVDDSVQWRAFYLAARHDYILIPVGGATEEQANLAASDLNNKGNRPYATFDEWLAICRALGIRSPGIIRTCDEVLAAIEQLKGSR